MTQPAHAQNWFKVNLRDYHFLLFEQFRIGEILGRAPYEGWSEDEVRTAISEAARFFGERLAPLNTVGDEQGCQLVDGQVRTPKGFKEVWQALWETGWKGISVDPEWGGAGAPQAVYALMTEMVNGANPAFNTYPDLSMGVGELISTLGTPEQRQSFCPNLYSGKWSGTMCLTEPQAGSDVGLARSRAVRNPDGTYSISGTKLFITAGDHDLTENIIHLVLARVEGAPAGTKGLTLFIVPKFRIRPDGSLGEPNDVTVGRVEHKMGINGSATCVLNFGENDRCVGTPVGGEGKLHQGMAQMFRMMNHARIGTGLQALGVAAVAYLNALQYARERKQGASIKNWKDASAPRVPIIEHADVRRMLLDMKARVEGLRALALKLVVHVDRARVASGKDDAAVAYHQGQVDLLVPLIKAYGSDQAFRICETAIQVHGGVGYTKDFPVEQYCRDSKIFSIYEGTNHIQAMDLVGRKLGQAGGNNMRTFLGDVATFVAAHGQHPVIGREAKLLGEAQEALMGTTMKFMAWFSGGQVELVPLSANRFLEMMSEVCVGWLLLEGAALAHEKKKALPEGHPDQAFYAGKIAAAQYYARNVVATVPLKAQLTAREDTSPLEIPDAGFAST